MTVMMVGALILAGCAREQVASDREPPSPPEFVPRTADTVLVEQGIDAVPDGDHIWLSWLPSDASDLAGYRLYRQAEDSSETAASEMIADLALADLGAEATPEYLDNSAILFSDSSRGFRYRVTAYDASGNESSPSQEANFRLIKKSDLQAPVAVGDTLKLSWNYTGDPFEVDYFVVRLFRWDADGPQGSLSDWTPFWLYKHDVYFPAEVDYVGALASGDYRYQVDVIGASPSEMPSGSEAAWQFAVP